MIYRGGTCSRPRTPAPGLSTQRHVQTWPSDGALPGDGAPRDAGGQQRSAESLWQLLHRCSQRGSIPRGRSTAQRGSTPRGRSTPRGSSSSPASGQRSGHRNCSDWSQPPPGGAFRPRYFRGALPASHFLSHTWALLPMPQSPPNAGQGPSCGRTSVRNTLRGWGALE